VVRGMIYQSDRLPLLPIPLPNIPLPVPRFRITAFYN
jgi:hypothetical protein